jgi:histidinol dehydrogenase
MPPEWLDERADELRGELVRPLQRVGVYVRGERPARPSSLMMAVIPAQVAGVGELAVASPPDPRGEISEPLLAACAVAGVHEVYRMGGAQAIAALAYGTATVRPVDKIVGAGNVYTTLAKRRVQGWVGVDVETAPPEIVIIADERADADVLAADLVAHAERGPHGTHALLTWSPELAAAVLTSVELQVMRHERSDDVENTLIEGGRAVLVRDLQHALDTANAFAPAKLELCLNEARAALAGVRNAGAVFAGPFSAPAAGDYVAGTNHLLPAGARARWSSGLSVRDFLKTVYVSGLEPSALERLEPHVAALAEAEGLSAHARAVEARLDSVRRNR